MIENHNPIFESFRKTFMKLTFENKLISYDLAMQLVKAAIEHARNLKLSVCIAIVDPTGHLTAFAKMDDACLIGIGTAQGKAYTAARSGLSTREFLNYLNENQVPLSSLQEEKLVLIAGGFPIYDEETLIGGIGVGGGTAKQDEECAQAALKTLLRQRI